MENKNLPKVRRSDLPASLPNLTNLPLASNELEASDGGHQISLIRKHAGHAAVKNTIVVVLFMIRDAFNVTRNLTDDQIIFTAEMIIQEYYFLNFSDLKLFYHKAVAGKYGKVYERIDPPTIMEWLAKYTESRQNQIEEMRINQTKIKDSGGVNPENLAELRKIAEAFEAKYITKEEEYRKFRAELIINEAKEKSE